MRFGNVIGQVLRFAGTCRWKMIISVLSAIVSVAGGLVPFWSTYEIILVLTQADAAGGTIWMWGLIGVGGYLIKIAFYGLSTILSHRSAYQILENMRLYIAGRLQRAPLGTVLSKTSGELKNCIVDRIETIELPLAHMIPEGISNLLLPLAICIYIFILDWRMALATLVSIPLGFAVYAVMMRNYNSQYASYMAAGNRVNSVIVEYIEGIQVIKAFNQSTGSYARYAETVASFLQYTLDWFKSTWKLMNLGAAILPSTLLGVLPMGMYLYSQGELQPSELTLCMILALSLVSSASWFNVAVNDYKSIEYAVRDARELMEMEEIRAAQKQAEITQQGIEFSHVSFAYHEETGDVLHDISFSLPVGSFTALVGPSGGGKSTIARLLARFWDVKKGSIRIGGAYLQDIPPKQLSNMISYVTQDNFLFNCSLLENIRLGNPQATDAQVRAAAQAAECNEFLEKLEHGWETSAGEAGNKLSGGEKQRIAIARAMLKDAPIVILDEATAFTDPENEEKLQASLARLTEGKTLLVIAHRLSTIRKADQILLLTEGRITARGTQEELLAGSPLYKELWEAHIGSRQWAAGK
ncbi:MAG: ABC transporter ATP-binding protein [Lachnospiraceae bacterium]